MASGGVLLDHAKPDRNEPAAMTHHDLLLECLAVGQRFAVDLPPELVMPLVRSCIRENPGTGLACRREGGLTTCTRVA